MPRRKPRGSSSARFFPPITGGSLPFAIPCSSSGPTADSAQGADVFLAAAIPAPRSLRRLRPGPWAAGETPQKQPLTWPPETERWHAIAPSVCATLKGNQLPSGVTATIGRCGGAGKLGLRCVDERGTLKRTRIGRRWKTVLRGRAALMPVMVWGSHGFFVYVFTGSIGAKRPPRLATFATSVPKARRGGHPPVQETLSGKRSDLLQWKA